jgi:CubicO group peptidase (beta-lactamase class C family)
MNKTGNRKIWLKACCALIASAAMVLALSDIFPVRQAEPGTDPADFKQYLDDRIPDLMNKYEIPGVCIALVKEGRVALTAAYGFADSGAGKQMSTDSLLRVQSISKSVTAWGILKLEQEGRIDLDDPAGAYLKSWQLPQSSYREEDITIRQLLSHTAGMPLGDIFNRFSPRDQVPSLKESLRQEAIPVLAPGTAFSYSNTGYNLLELLIEEVTGQDFAAYMSREVLNPLGMANSTYAWNESIDSRIPNGYDLSGQAIPVYIYPEKGSGGLFASVEDIAGFVASGMPKFNRDFPVLSAQQIDRMYEPQAQGLGLYSFVFDSYGLGHYIENLPEGLQAVSHGGQGTGWMTHFHSVPERGEGIIILTNSQRSWPFIAYLLGDWAGWNGFSGLGMERIITGLKALWLVTGALWFVFIWRVWQLAEDIYLKKRKLAPFAGQSRRSRMIRFMLGVLIILILIWAVSQPYLTITSIFPIASFWLGVSMLMTALLLIFSGLFAFNTNKPD